MFYKLPPAGDPVLWTHVSSTSHVFKAYFGPRLPKFYGSGTEALAAAISAATKLRDSTNPEVLLPAYTCPAVVSAVIYAGAKPILVDFEYQRPWMSLRQLSQKISKDTVAVIAVHLFGVPERVKEIHKITKDANLVLIEDSAQYMRRSAKSLQGDFVVLSFGRGKPVSLLGGGAVLSKDARTEDALPSPDPRRRFLPIQTSSFNVKVWLYNLFLSPSIYWLPASLPFLHLGETRYQPLKAISGMADAALRHLPAVLCQYGRRNDDVQKRISEMLSQFNSNAVLDLPRVCGAPNVLQFPRYPLLILRPYLRDQLVQALDRAGLGASVMYPHALPHILGLEQILASQGYFDQADRFSQCILTLPTHSGVNTKHVETIGVIFRDTLRREYT